ncbi:MAG: twin-arginine translocase TatA/TatE family subunit [Verrucomicrobiota bacterium]
MTPPATLLSTPAAFIDGVGGPELVLILVVALLLFGGKGMPNMARTVGKTLREFKKATSGIEEEIKRAMHDDPEPVVRRRPDPARGEALPAPPPAETEKPAKPAPPDHPPAAGA